MGILNFIYVKLSNQMQKRVILCFTFLLFFSQWTYADDDAEKLRQDLLELERFANPFVQIFQKVSSLVGPSVVSIVAEHSPETVSDPHDILPSPFFPPQKKEDNQSNQRKPSFGSGIIIKKSGFILTNFHVINGFENGRITVILHDSRKYDAVIFGKDPNSDLAVLKIDGENLREAHMGDPKRVKVGDWVIAIGNPFGYSQTVSAGIVSAIGRTNVTPLAKPFAYEDFIQTDAAINPGNSGGPLVNLRGEIIGVNSAIATRTGGFQGVGFAISAEIAATVMIDLIEKGHVIRGYLGVGIQNINENLASYLDMQSKDEVLKRFKLDSDSGAFISEVWRDTPASIGGVLPGDVIIQFGERKVSNIGDLKKAIRASAVDSLVPLIVLRNKDAKPLVVKIEQQPDSMSGKTFVSIKMFSELPSFYTGLTVGDITSEKAEGEDAEKINGVIVEQVEKDSPGERAGIVPGDIILKVGTKNVNTKKEFQAAVHEALAENTNISLFIKTKGYATLK
ncbi:MAG: PDZ domain-containing protein [Candidatus Scalindua sp. AMX11]|nr:MAG: PDZ domain-containing protein [Candidatus Scalindua sp.]NOG84885.1 PDZ domain-containing protein [Planctomycetota bacterium]RZV84953.1 MAG: PDZ domain-containing protein [Candidatus Scalindua sp. SCAELEC01]TDE65054.1 MAG: PDZ domain-containing protein [Candidatus Scalindua sp. AMX11]GJQ59446.1 MAG: MucD protein [Candidatus Scalindua sp.]